MPTLLPKDQDNNPIQVLKMRDGGAHQIAVTSTSAKNVTAFDNGTQVISLYATGPVYIKFGGSDVVATTGDHFFPGGIYYDVSLGNGKASHASHVAVLAADQDCVLYVSEKD